MLSSTTKLVGGQPHPRNHHHHTHFRGHHCVHHTVLCMSNLTSAMLSSPMNWWSGWRLLKPLMMCSSTLADMCLHKSTTRKQCIVSLLFVLFWGRVEQIFQNGPANIWAHENWKQIFGYFKLRFHNELLHWQKNRFLVFFRAGLHLHVRKISTLSVKQFKLFAKISYFFDN